MNKTNINPEMMLILQEMRKKKEQGEILDPQIIEALQAIDIASKVVNTIMSGNQIDPVFLKNLSSLAQKRASESTSFNDKKKTVLKKKKNKKIKV
jgi:hypothetical protein